MSFSVDDIEGLLRAAASLDTGAADQTLSLLQGISGRFSQLASTVNEFPSIPETDFRSVVRDEFQPRLLAIGTDSTSTASSLLGMTMSLQEFRDQIPQVKSAAANLEQVLNQSSSPADWKSPAAPLASALNNLYSANVPAAPAANQTLNNLAQAKAKAKAGEADAAKPASSEADKAQSATSGQPAGGSAPTAQQPATAQKSQSDDSNQSQPSSQGSGSGSSGSPSGSGSGGDQGGGSGSGSGGGSPAGAGAGGAPAGTGADSSKKPANAAASLSGSACKPLASTGLQSAADLLPGTGLGGGAGGLDPRTLGAAPGSAATLSSAAGAPGAGAAGVGRSMSSMMGGMMGGRGGGGEKEHKAPDYLYNEDNGYELIEKLPVISPDVIGALTEDEAVEMELQTGFVFSDQA